MMQAQDRIRELAQRQIFYGSSLYVKLESVNGYFYYKVWALLDQGKTDNQSSVIEGKYKGEDPEDLMNLALQELNLKKIKRGIPLT